MGYIKAIIPLKDYRLLMDMESGSIVIVDLTVKLNTMKYKELGDEKIFFSVKTDGDYVTWGDGKVKVTVHELLDVVLLGEYPSKF